MPFKKFLFTVISAFFIMLPISVSAADVILVNCGRTDQSTACTICDLISGIHGVIKFLVEVVGIAGIVVITVAGIVYIVSVGDSGMTLLAKTAVKNTLIGIMIMLFAFISITFILNNVFQNESSKLRLSQNYLSGLGSNAWNFTCTVGSSGTTTTPGTTTPGTTDPGTTDPGGTDKGDLGTLSKNCDKYDDSFNSAANGNKDTACLLKSIAMTESGCNQNVGRSSAGAVGFMQIKPENAGGANLNDADSSIKRAADLLKSNQSQINNYSYFNASDGTGLGATKESFPDGKSYYSGNDDLIASYNGGGGTKASAGKLGAFAESEGCKGRAGYPDRMPAWQCQYYKDGTIEGATSDPGKQGYKETRDYVQKVQNYQKQCLGN